MLLFCVTNSADTLYAYQSPAGVVTFGFLTIIAFDKFYFYRPWILLLLQVATMKIAHYFYPLQHFFFVYNKSILSIVILLITLE
jgi:hypothetical protein